MIFNGILYFQYKRSLLLWGMTRPAERIVFAFFLTMIQIMASLLFLGAVGWLSSGAAVVLNVGIFLWLMVCPGRGAPVIFKDGAWKEIESSVLNKLIVVLAGAVTAWLLVSAYFLPPRGVDDICYDLPVIYDSIQHGRWTLLPTQLRIHFAYPMNAEALFAWPILFLREQTCQELKKGTG